MTTVFALIFAAQLSVEEAYQAIPHRRTTWDETQTKMPKETSRALHELFQLSDEGVVLRVETMGSIDRKDLSAAEMSLNKYSSLLEKIIKHPTPKELLSFKKLLISAIEKQRDFLSDSLKIQYVKRSPWAPLAREASQKLHEAYAVLMSQFPEESPRNKQAFFDYLCALDFI